MNKIKPENFFVVQGWMCLPEEQGGLGLKGNNLVIFSVIYGFCQQPGHYFNGSLEYLQEWTGATRQGIIKNLDNLLLRGLILKTESKPTNIYKINYNALPSVKKSYVNNVSEESNLVNNDVNNVNDTSEDSLHNNINNNTNNIDNNTFVKSKELSSSVNEIISYLNSVCGTKFKSNTSATKRLIKSRLDEGFSLQDFKNVIECKYEDWGKSPTRFTNGQWSNEYLRPQTLFGNKFESYVHEAGIRKTPDTQYTSKSSEVDTDVSSLTF